MPVYLRKFYYKTLSDQLNSEQTAREKALSKSSPKQWRPGMEKPSGKTKTK